MKKLVFLFSVLLLRSSIVKADEWKTADTALLSGAVVMLSVDWAQTLYIVNHPAYHETNPLLGRHPSSGKVNLYFAGAIATTIGASILLPEKYRRFALGSLIVMETYVVIRNNSIGVGMAF